MTDRGFSIQFKWKEEVIYWEGERGYVFDGGWGAEPPVTHVPDVATWDSVVPDWLRGRRAEIIERLEAEPGHVVKVVPDYSPSPAREVLRGWRQRERLPSRHPVRSWDRSSLRSCSPTWSVRRLATGARVQLEQKRSGDRF